MCKEKNSFTEEEKELIQKLLENTSVNFLLGAGASFFYEKNKLNFPLMADLLNTVKSDNNIIDFISRMKEAKDNPIYEEILKLYEFHLFSDEANIEEFLSQLEAFVNLLAVNDTIKKDLIEQRDLSMSLILKRINESDCSNIIGIYEKFYNTLIKINKKSEKVSTKKYNVFTTNYDMLNEAAMENLKLYYYSGFFGVYDRKFNMSYYNYSYTDTVDLYGHKYYEKTNYINLYKLHGSLSWQMNNNELVEVLNHRENKHPVIIYPSMTKYNLTNLIVYYQSLLREFSSKLQKPNSSLFVIGSSLGDEHLLKIIENTLDLENFNLVIFSYSDVKNGSIIDILNKRENVYVFTGNKCTLLGFSSIYE